MDTINWFQVGVDLLQAIIGGIFVGVAVFLLDEWRAKRERRLADFRIATNWELSEKKVRLRNFDLTKANLSGGHFEKADLEKTVFSHAELWGTNFSNANLRDANLQKTRMVGTIFTNAMIYRANFTKANIFIRIYPDITYQPDFKNAVLHRAFFKQARIVGASFSGADLEGADFSGATVKDSDFTGADLTDSKWKKVRHVEGCTWQGVKGRNRKNFPARLWAEIERQNAEPHA